MQGDRQGHWDSTHGMPENPLECRRVGAGNTVQQTNTYVMLAVDLLWCCGQPIQNNLHSEDVLAPSFSKSEKI